MDGTEGEMTQRGFNRMIAVNKKSRYLLEMTLPHIFVSMYKSNLKMERESAKRLLAEISEFLK